MKPKNKIITFRISIDDYKYFLISSHIVGLSSSKMIRLLLDRTITAIKIAISKGELKYEDYTYLWDDIIQHNGVFEDKTK